MINKTITAQIIQPQPVFFPTLYHGFQQVRTQLKNDEYSFT